jgi:hypothetical protein
MIGLQAVYKISKQRALPHQLLGASPMRVRDPSSERLCNHRLIRRAINRNSHARLKSQVTAALAETSSYFR